MTIPKMTVLCIGTGIRHTPADNTASGHNETVLKKIENDFNYIYCTENMSKCKPDIFSNSV